MKAETTIALVKEMERSKKFFAKYLYTISITVFGIASGLFVGILIKTFENYSGEELNWISEALLIICLSIMFVAYSFITQYRMNKKFLLIIETLLENKNHPEEK